MRLSRHFGRTLREAPAEAGSIGQQLIMRAGLARSLAPGLPGYLPFGWRVIRRLAALAGEEIEACGAEEIHLPALISSRLEGAVGDVIADLGRREIESYRDLPRAVYFTRPAAHGELPADRGGWLRLREELILEAYSLHAERADLESFCQRVRRGWANVFARCDLPVLPVEAEDGSRRFMWPHPEGESRFTRCDGCERTASIEAASFVRREARYGDPQPMEKVATPECKTIADLCAFLGIEPERTLKAVFYTVDAAQGGEDTVLVMLRGDLEVSEAKLARVLDAQALRPATEEEIRERTGAEPGYASPIGLEVRGTNSPEGVQVIVDESLLAMSNFVTGANEAGYHVINANYERDFTASLLADIAEAYEGAICPHCGGSLHIERAVELGYCLRTGTRHSEAAGATYLDANGRPQPVVMGRYGVYLDRLLTAVVETHHDQYGIIWPPEVAPFDLHLVALAKDEEAARTAETLYEDLRAAGLKVLYDDRRLSPGVMFADADLIGLPLRLTISRRSLQNGGVEIKWRHEKERSILALEGIVEQIIALLASPPS